MIAHKSISLRNLMEKDYPNDPIIKDLLDRGESLIICGKSGIGKSVITLNIALYVACPEIRSSHLSKEGPPALFDQWSIPKSIKVLFIQSENSARATKARAEKMCLGNPLFKEGLDKIIMPLDDDNEIIINGVLTDPTFQDKIFRLIVDNSIDLLIIDPLISFHNGNENDNMKMRESLDCLSRIISKTKTACIVIHHVGKYGSKNDVFSGRGASAIGDWAHNIMIVEEGKDYISLGEDKLAKPLVITHTKSRNHDQVNEFAIARDKNLIFKRCPLGQKEEAHESNVKEVVDALRALGGKVDKQQALIEYLEKSKGIGRTSAQNLVREACKKELIIPTKDGGKKVGYKLP
ncbi:MAG TPA: AAA family ATPase [Deltaproteobacteria bacterium]|jgi:RecA-family ATPase|nr:AAA family ATPase [Deltaproteobacteria bacterium]HNS89834.1 AAA family ATPase [Deltaproteobacteria bacterium]HOY75068.1 AAA family ATPase [Deltaproteobacteria bacterium]HQM71996.1 AAA family ATPase [Deltaproteobacteria bacterium]HUM18663.1 AAA family ATPase [Deltaproteobacteria bacterium]